MSPRNQCRMRVWHSARVAYILTRNPVFWRTTPLGKLAEKHRGIGKHNLKQNELSKF